MFLAHINSLKENEYSVLDQFNKERVLVNNNGYKIVSNICPHQKSLISSFPGKGNRTCPFHGWEFTINGQPVSSGKTEQYCENTKELKIFPTYEWSNLVFDTPINFKEKLDLTDLILMEKRIDIVNSSSKNIMDIFLDVDHIPLIHENVYEKIGFDIINDVEWSYYENGTIQHVQGKAMWIAVYPYTMIEWQLGSLFVTVAMEKEKNKSNVVVFKYRNKNSSDYEWLYNNQTWETSWQQDKEQAERMLTTNFSNLEEQKLHYKNWLDKNGFSSQ